MPFEDRVRDQGNTSQGMPKIDSKPLEAGKRYGTYTPGPQKETALLPPSSSISSLQIVRQ